MTDVPTTPRKPMGRMRRRMPQMSRPGAPAQFFEMALRYQGDECLFWPHDNVRGYGRIKRNGKKFFVSRLVCEAEHGPPPSPEHHAAHSCGNGDKGCVTRKHVSWKTPKENNADKLEHGTLARGERNGRAKLSPDQVREILALKGKLLQREIAQMFGVGQVQVSRIHRRDKWGSLDA
jgi:hypothetical protein